MFVIKLHVYKETHRTGNWLLLRGGIIPSVPCNCGHFPICWARHLSSNHSRFVHQSSLLWSQQRHLVAKRGGTRQEIPVNFAHKYLCLYIQVSLKCRKILQHRPDSFTSSPKEVVLRILSPLKGYRSRSGSNPRTLSLIAKTITITSPRTNNAQKLYHELVFLLRFWFRRESVFMPQILEYKTKSCHISKVMFFGSLIGHYWLLGNFKPYVIIFINVYIVKTVDVLW